MTIAGGVGDIFNYNIGGGVINLTAATANPAAEIATAVNADPVLTSETGGVITVTGASDGTSCSYCECEHRQHWVCCCYWSYYEYERYHRRHFYHQCGWGRRANTNS